MPDKDPTTYSLVTYAWVFFLSAWGGFINFWGKVKRGDARFLNITELIGELMTSAFAGIMTFYLCEAASIDALLTAAMVGISGHMGSRAIFMFEKWLEDRIKRWIIS